MKKFLALSLLLGSSAIFASSAEAKTNAVTENVGSTVALEAGFVPQGNVRIVTRTKIVRRGFRTFRETWQYRYFRNGRVTSRLVSRVRVR